MLVGMIVQVTMGMRKLFEGLMHPARGCEAKRSSLKREKRQVSWIDIMQEEGHGGDSEISRQAMNAEAISRSRGLIYYTS